MRFVQDIAATRRWIAAHLRTPICVLQQLSSSSDSSTLALICTHPNCPSATLDSIAKKSNRFDTRLRLQTLIVAHSATTEETLLWLMTTRTPMSTYYEILGRTTIPRSVLVAIVQKTWYHDLRALALARLQALDATVSTKEAT